METALIVFVAVVFFLGGMVGWFAGRRSLRRAFEKEMDRAEILKPPITNPQREIIANLCRRLHRPVPDRLDEFSESDADDLIEDLRDELQDIADARP